MPRPGPPTGPALTEMLLAQMDSALAQGAYEPVHRLLASKADHELDGAPDAWLLRARSAFDLGDFDDAERGLVRLDSLGADRGVVAHWRARVLAAAGKEERADEGLEIVRASGLSSEQVATTELLVHLSLGRLDRLAPTSKGDQETVDTSPSAPSADGYVARTLARNLGSLRLRQPDLAARLGRLRPWDRFALVELEGIWTPLRKTGADPVPIFDPNEMNAREAQALAACQPELSLTTPVLMIGPGTGALVEQIGSIKPAQGKRVALVVVAPRWDELAALLMIHDWSELLRERALRFLGDDPHELIEYLSADLRRVPKTYRYVGCDLLGTEFSIDYARQVEQESTRIASDANEKIARTEAYYASDAFRARWTGAGRSERLRILIQTCRYTTFVHNNSRHLRQAFHEAGHEVELLEEGDDQENWLGPAFLQDRIADFRPDLYVRTNFLRQEDPTRTPAGMPLLTWVQDNCPTHIDSCEPGRMLPRDYLTGIGKFPRRVRGYSASHFLSNPVPSLASVYSAPACGPRRYRYDVSFVSHHSTPPAVWIDRFRRGAVTGELADWVEQLYTRLTASYSAGEIIYSVADQYGADFVRSAPVSRMASALDYSVQLTNLFYRQRILEWVSGAGHDLAVFGAGWQSHPTLVKHARGPVANGAALREVYRATRVNLQLMTTGNLHQRLVDGYLAGGFFLMPRQDAFRRQLACLDSDLDARLYRTLAMEPVCAVADLAARDPQLVDYLERLAAKIERPQPAFVESSAAWTLLFAEQDLNAFLELRLDSLAEVTFGDRDEMLALLSRWLERDDEREQFSDAVQRSAGLRSLTAEHLVTRLIDWLRQRVAVDPPFILPQAIFPADSAESLRSEAIEDASEDDLFRILESDSGSTSAEGHVRAGVAEGVWTAFHPDGSRRLVTQLRSGRPHGSWSEWHEGGARKSERTYSNGVAEGRSTEWHANGSTAAAGECHEGRKQGVWITWHDTGAKARECEYRNGMRHGIETRWHPNGARMAQERYVDGLRHGPATQSHACGSRAAVGVYENGLKQGRWLFWHESGAKACQCDFRADKQHGCATRWHPNGTLQSREQFVDGRRQGESSSWHENGVRIAQGEYREGHKHGVWTAWRPTGEKHTETEFAGGKPHGVATCWYPSGALFWRADFRDGRLHGTRTRWYSDGTVRATIEFRDGKLHGALTIFDPNGVKILERLHHDGRRHGPLRRWHPSGKPKAQTEYEDGNAVGKYVRWFPDGGIAAEAEFRAGRLHGVWSRRDSDGRVRNRSDWRDGHRLTGGSEQEVEFDSEA